MMVVCEELNGKSTYEQMQGHSNFVYVFHCIENMYYKSSAVPVHGKCNGVRDAIATSPSPTLRKGDLSSI